MLRTGLYIKLNQISWCFSVGRDLIGCVFSMIIGKVIQKKGGDLVIRRANGVYHDKYVHRMKICLVEVGLEVSIPHW
jgi:hypothetical protein